MLVLDGLPAMMPSTVTSPDGRRSPAVLTDWEAMWAPYDEQTYLKVLQEITSDDLVLDIGAGDLRLSLRMAAVARRVDAVERNPEIIQRGPPEAAYPANLKIHLADALEYPFPNDVTTAVLLMRHGTHFRNYFAKLRAVGCSRLITNARWRIAVEIVDLSLPRLPYRQASAGWYACCCGAVGFIPGRVEELESFIDRVSELVDCPSCSPTYPPLDQPDFGFGQRK